MQKLIQADYLRQQLSAVLIAASSSSQEAETVANNLVMANLSGHDSHGVGMLPRYIDAVLEGGLTPNATLKTLLDTGSLLTLNAQHGYGQVMGEQAMQLGIERAKVHGSCIMTLADSHHLGRIGHFAEMAVAQGLVSIHFVNVISRPVVAPWGGTDGRFGTNPCCIGIPLNRQGQSNAAHQNHFILDFATSKVAQGKMRVAHNQGKTVAPGLLIDERGLPTTNPGVVVVPQSTGEEGAPGIFGALMPFGEHKGYGLAVACELLGGALTGGGTWHKTMDAAGAKVRAVTNSMLTILIDPAKLGTQAALENDSVAFIDWLRKSPAAQGFDAVQIAGEPERKARLKRAQDGIEIDAQTWDEIVHAAKKFGVTL
ncbi:Hydroxycarboxylate dehydrogenase B [Polaromonas vacuolata]|uniref:Hydroxycarboxylate dehydrogenase B n=1 Tax=Polaromonas vacuolata TaxID=37448 RepID=A0A6H2HCE8_9BURK|nr:malate/lactate/ureidoglycolate dehydrogenase [Polaromonas vacuolata]QJC57552.1 Hydroxycarboxylate dehydrogenase B [Polaromonas vacuolata]